MAEPFTALHDVVIVGAGPAGAILGYQLAKKGIDVLIVEKGKLPRYKTCAGGITVRAANLLDFDISPVTERAIYGVRITYKLGDECVKQYDEPLIHMVTRARFDHFLVQKAQEAGATVIDGQRVNQIQMMDGQAMVTTADYRFKTRIVAGADGANSIVARSLGLMSGGNVGLAVQAEVFASSEAIAKWNSTVGFDFGYMPSGYGWIFPKKDYLSIGAWGSIHLAKDLQPYYRRLVESQHLGNHRVDSFKGHPMRLRKAGMAIQRDNALLLGDAAGLIHAFSGEGIYYAIRSAQLAAPVIANALESNSIELQDYERAVDRKLMPELQLGQRLLRLYSRSPWLYFNWLKRSNHLWRAACRWIRGENSFIRQELGPYRPLLALLTIKARRSR
jgi:geranylgeranyl reductase family protein